MEPALKEGQIVAVHTIRNFKPGSVVVAYVQGREVIKRVHTLQDGQVFLLGDNAAHSTDSRHYGAVPDTMIEGVVFWPRV